MSAPREIWLQTEDNPASTDAFKVVSWCESALNSTAVPYILKSDFDALQTKLTAAEEKLAKIYATEPVGYRKRFPNHWALNDVSAMMSEDALHFGWTPLIPKPQEAV